MSWITNYVQDVSKEMKKVNWPDRDELVSNTTITIVATLLISAFIFGADQVISTVLEVVYQVLG
jgi:preprotein translocase subunit SecE